MDSTRQQKINRLLQKELSEIFQKDAKHMPGIIISVSAVKVSPDLGMAKVYLSIFPSNKGKELVKSINKNTKTVRFDLGQRVAKQLRVIPQLYFYLDDSLDYLENIDKILGSIKKDEPANEE